MQAVNSLQLCYGVLLSCEVLLKGFQDEQIVFRYFEQKYFEVSL
jgi:hypothetical protein